ncbi:MAG: hypothetical protein KAR03_12370 [Candidatus Thorarchaeota archaeon]|nr:hypothetical protein [Candidatus Thorarchaeota archaeon]
MRGRPLHSNYIARFIDEMKELGYEGLTARELIEMNIHGVDADFVRSMQEKGIKDLTIRKLVKIKIHGIFD